MEDGEITLYEEDIEAFEVLLDAFAEKASPQLRTFACKVKVDLRNKTFLERRGIF
jgi:hypothetical protein